MCCSWFCPMRKFATMCSSLPQHYNDLSQREGVCRVAGSGKKHVSQTMHEQVFATKNRPASLQSGVEKSLIEPGQNTYISGGLWAFVGSIAQTDIGEHDFDENHGQQHRAETV